MALYDASGKEIRKISDEQIVNAIGTLDKRSNAQQYQLMQLGLLVEFMVEKLGMPAINGEPIFTLNEEEFSAWSDKRFKEIQEQASRMMALAQEDKTPPVNLED